MHTVRRGELDEREALRRHERLTLTIDSTLSAKAEGVVALAPLSALVEP